MMPNHNRCRIRCTQKHRNTKIKTAGFNRLFPLKPASSYTVKFSLKPSEERKQPLSFYLFTGLFPLTKKLSTLLSTGMYNLYIKISFILLKAFFGAFTSFVIWITFFYNSYCIFYINIVYYFQILISIYLQKRYCVRTLKELNLCDDFLFKETMKDEHLAAQLLQTVLNLPGKIEKR